MNLARRPRGVRWRSWARFRVRVRAIDLLFRVADKLTSQKWKINVQFLKMCSFVCATGKMCRKDHVNNRSQQRREKSFGKRTSDIFAHRRLLLHWVPVIPPTCRVEYIFRKTPLLRNFEISKCVYHSKTAQKSAAQ